jgi:N-methylhydantoinase A
VPFLGETDGITGAAMEELYDRFDALYEEAYGRGSAYREAGREMITFRVTAVGKLEKPNLERGRAFGFDAKDALKRNRSIYFEEYRDFVPTSVYDFERLNPGAEIAGPAIIETPVTTVVVNPGERAAMDEFRNLIIAKGENK